MKHSTTNYYLQSKKDNGVQIVGHGQDDKTGEIYYRFLDRKGAKELMKDEKKVSPEYEYRIVKETIIYEEGNWE